MLKKPSVPFIAFLQATGLVIYLVFISSFFTFAPLFFKNDLNNEFYAPIIMLLLFIISAVISAMLVLGKAGVYFWEKKYKESFKLLGWTVGWGLFYLIGIVTVVFFK